ncbi:hypothetical protein PsYK624_126900 [Phanerochaete sordida]|uniref:Uncharacterized protein n=1 Tax=Phanerochaete sordida TaxID=48140 RepID=A0A9P3LIS8_9APHY|nr:hypothetical protein PsYK624_126900 [Phanerochaete sordida]
MGMSEGRPRHTHGWAVSELEAVFLPTTNVGRLRIFPSATPQITISENICNRRSIPAHSVSFGPLDMADTSFSLHRVSSSFHPVGHCARTCYRRRRRTPAGAHAQPGSLLWSRTSSPSRV